MNWRSIACAIGALALCGAPSTLFAQATPMGVVVAADGNCPSGTVLLQGVGRPVYGTSKGAICISGTINASLSTFQPSASGSRMTPLSVGLTDSSGTLPTGAQNLIFNTDAANVIYCNEAGVAATVGDAKIPANSWIELTPASGVTTLHCIAVGGTVLANGLGGAGIATGSGGGGGGGSSGGTVEIAPYTLTSTGFQLVSSFSTSTGFTPPATSTLCFVQAEGNNVRFRTDGSAPTATVGQLMPTGSVIPFTANLSGVRFIPVTGNATLDVDCYK